MQLTMSAPVLVHAPTVTDAVREWGVYAIPRLWRAPGGELVVRLNGERDDADRERMQRAPNLYFTSRDEGVSWQYAPQGERLYDVSVLTGIDPPYTTLASGDTVYLRGGRDLPPLSPIPYHAQFLSPCRDAVVRTYRWGDIAPECRALFFGRIAPDGTHTQRPVHLDFEERLLHVVAEANVGGELVKVDEYVHPFIFRLPYFSAIRETRQGELVALSCGQCPDVTDRSYTMTLRPLMGSRR